MHCVHCGRLILRDPAASVKTRGQTLHYGPKCAARLGLVPAPDPRRSLRARVTAALRPTRQRRRGKAMPAQLDWVNEMGAI